MMVVEMQSKYGEYNNLHLAFLWIGTDLLVINKDMQHSASVKESNISVPVSIPGVYTPWNKKEKKGNWV